MGAMLNVLVTMRFDQGQLDRLRAVSPEILVSQADAETADYARTDVLYAGAPPRELGRAPGLRWVQLHMAGVNTLADHPLYTETAIPLTTTSGVHAATIAEYAVTMLLALAHRVPRMVEERPALLVRGPAAAAPARRSASSAMAASAASSRASPRLPSP